MLKVGHKTLIVISGCIWLAIGCFLLSLGMNFVVSSLLIENREAAHPLLNGLTSLAGSIDTAGIIVIALGLAIGLLKGRVIFSKTVQKSVDRILTLPNPVSLARIYTKKYYILLGSMVFLGFLVRFLPNDIRGFVDIAIGAALINGALLYFRMAFSLNAAVSD